MTTDWREAVEENRSGIESWAESDLPLAEEMQQLLDEADKEVSTR